MKATNPVKLLSMRRVEVWIVLIAKSSGISVGQDTKGK
jgi:hypothetical protein